MRAWLFLVPVLVLGSAAALAGCPNNQVSSTSGMFPDYGGDDPDCSNGDCECNPCACEGQVPSYCKYQPSSSSSSGGLSSSASGFGGSFGGAGGGGGGGGMKDAGVSDASQD